MNPRKKSFPWLRKWGRGMIMKSLKILGEDLDVVSLEGALERRQKATPQIGSVIDIGASDGRWSIVCHKYYPQASYFLIEAQQPHRPSLEALKKTMPTMEFVMAAAGDSTGEIYFDASDLLGGIASHQPFENNNIVVPCTTVDAEVSARKLKPPYLLKLDVHGFEIPILNGSAITLANTALIVMEVYNMQFTSENLRFHQMVTEMEARGFRVADLSEPVHRPSDHALFQFDLFFVPKNHSMFNQKGFFSTQ
jgi:FkbM family methyltransferase